MSQANSTHHANRSPGLLPNPPALTVIENHASETDIKLFMNAIVTISKTLSEGIENPKDLVYFYNAILNQHGYPDIHVPQNIIDSSKAIFLNKLAMNQENNSNASEMSPQTLVYEPAVTTVPSPVSTPTPLTLPPVTSPQPSHPPIPNTDTTSSTSTTSLPSPIPTQAPQLYTSPPPVYSLCSPSPSTTTSITSLSSSTTSVTKSEQTSYMNTATPTGEQNNPTNLLYTKANQPDICTTTTYELSTYKPNPDCKCPSCASIFTVPTPSITTMSTLPSSLPPSTGPPSPPATAPSPPSSLTAMDQFTATYNAGVSSATATSDTKKLN